MNTRTRATLGLSALLGLGLLAVDMAPATAAPPPHARANGYYRNQNSGRDYDRRSQTSRRDFDRDGTPDYRDRDIDNDGVPNQRDRDDYTRRGWSSQRGNDRNWRDNYYRGNDHNWRENDRDRRDGDRNWGDRDRRDNDRHDHDRDGDRNRYDRNDSRRGR